MVCSILSSLFIIDIQPLHEHQLICTVQMALIAQGLHQQETFPNNKAMHSPSYQSPVGSPAVKWTLDQSPHPTCMLTHLSMRVIKCLVCVEPSLWECFTQQILDMPKTLGVMTTKTTLRYSIVVLVNRVSVFHVLMMKGFRFLGIHLGSTKTSGLMNSEPPSDVEL